ncbi:hypothetical protein [Tuberibacillus sp. Marseille-P3662]|uniref:hypothetical protein n=1 Tax=Tuberibacillus sp. Marseille-P3662 TaxID=1965358 RepID=UPI000A1CB8BF|nr:hypothetical protein [Tuberibacillus sp. Marseille-P3662]
MFGIKKRLQRDKQIKEINERMQHIENSLQTLSKQGLNYYVTIEHLDVKDPVLEHLDFNFDSLDVKEVSGALNVGNNFGVNVHSKKQGEQKKQQQTSSVSQNNQDQQQTSSSSNRNGEWHRNNKGLSYTFSQNK